MDMESPWLKRNIDIVFNDNEDFDSSDESDAEEAAKNEYMKTTCRRYAAIFNNGNFLDLTTLAINPLAAPAVKDEGRRDLKHLRWEKYFGQESRKDFNGRANWVNDKIQTMNKDIDIAVRVQLSSKMDYDTDFAFAPRRSAKKSHRQGKPTNLKQDKDKNSHNKDNDKDNTDFKYLCPNEDGNDKRVDRLHATVPQMWHLANATSASVVSDTTLNTTCTEIERGAPTSPRTRFIGNCLNSHLNPRPALILRKHVSNELDLRHQVRNKM